MQGQRHSVRYNKTHIAKPREPVMWVGLTKRDAKELMRMLAQFDPKLLNKPGVARKLWNTCTDIMTWQ